MKNSIILILSLLACFSSFAQNGATPVPTVRSSVPVIAIATIVSSSNPNSNANEAPTTAIPNISGRELIPVGVASTQVGNNSTQLRITQNLQQSTAVPNAVILKSVPQTSVATRIDGNKEINKTTQQNK